MLMTTDPGDLVLDPTCGSGTTAYVAEQWGRRWITIDTSRVSIALARTRLMAGRFPYYILSDSPEGALKEAEETGILPPVPLPSTGGDIKKGFVYKRVPHITLKSIANNEEIDEIHARWEAPLEELRAEINRCWKKWEEWQIPRKSEEIPERSRPCQRPSKNIGTCAANASKKSTPPSPAAPTANCSTTSPTKTRNACGSPAPSPSKASPRTASCPQMTPPTAAGNKSTDGFVPHDHRKPEKGRRAEHHKNERLKFDRLEPYAGLWLHAAGEYTENSPPAERGR